MTTGMQGAVDFFKALAAEITKYVHENPRDFVFLILLVSSPLLMLSAFMSWKLSKRLETQGKKKKQTKKNIKSNSRGPRAKRD